jgi:L-rhamnose isomerase
MYGDFSGGFVDRDSIEGKHFDTWLDWGKEQDIQLDFNATCFAHPRASSGFTLSSKDTAVRQFWIEHVKRAREISAYLGKKQGSPCIHNLWIPDGSKDIPVDRLGYRQVLKNSLDKIFANHHAKEQMNDAIECKLFGIGSEAFVVGSHEFYLGYAVQNRIMPCLDLGHFHPTELVADKISSLLLFSDELLLHVSRPLRWDSDHVVIYNDDIMQLSQELVRSGRLPDIHIGLDFFDATINRIGAWAVGARSTLKGLLFALLEPHQQLVTYENEGNYFARLALLEELKAMPFGLVWDYYCERTDVATDRQLIAQIQNYENDVLSTRS